MYARIVADPTLSKERQFNGMFRTSLDPVDPLSDFAQDVAGKGAFEN